MRVVDDREGDNKPLFVIDVPVVKHGDQQRGEKRKNPGRDSIDEEIESVLNCETEYMDTTMQSDVDKVDDDELRIINEIRERKKRAEQAKILKQDAGQVVIYRDDEERRAIALHREREAKRKERELAQMWEERTIEFRMRQAAKTRDWATFDALVEEARNSAMANAAVKVSSHYKSLKENSSHVIDQGICMFFNANCCRVRGKLTHWQDRWEKERTPRYPETSKTPKQQQQPRRNLWDSKLHLCYLCTKLGGVMAHSIIRCPLLRIMDNEIKDKARVCKQQ